MKSFILALFLVQAVSASVMYRVAGPAPFSLETADFLQANNSYIFHSAECPSCVNTNPGPDSTFLQLRVNYTAAQSNFILSYQSSFGINDFTYQFLNAPLNLPGTYNQISLTSLGPATLEVSGNAPEPGALCLVGLGLLGGIWGRKRLKS